MEVVTLRDAREIHSFRQQLSPPAAPDRNPQIPRLIRAMDYVSPVPVKPFIGLLRGCLHDLFSLSLENRPRQLTPVDFDPLNGGLTYLHPEACQGLLPSDSCRDAACGMIPAIPPPVSSPSPA